MKTLTISKKTLIADARKYNLVTKNDAMVYRLVRILEHKGIITSEQAHEILSA